MDAQIQPMSLGDLFEKTVNLIGKSFVKNLILGAIFLIIPIIIMVSAARKFFGAMTDFSGLSGQGDLGPSIHNIFSVFRVMSVFWGALILFSVCVLLAEIAVSIVVSKEFKSEPVDVGSVLGDTFDSKWLYGIGQALLKLAIFAGGMVVAGICIAILAVVITTVGEGAQALMVAILVVFIIALIAAIIFFSFMWFFSLTAVAVDGLSPVESLRKSWKLVKGHWWRTFGIVILFAIITQFVISIVSLPITFAGMWNFYKHFFTMLGNTQGQIDIEALHDLQRSLGPAIGIGSGVSSFLSLLITPAYTVVMYYDLRARRGEFVAPEVSPAPPLTPQEPLH